jgi:hypothetical protein
MRALLSDQGAVGELAEMGLASDGFRKSSRVAAGHGGAFSMGSAPEMACPQAKYR